MPDPMNPSVKEAPACPGPQPHQSGPTLFKVPPGAVDTHAHVIGLPPDYPFMPERSYTPPEATAQSYIAMLDATGMTYGVLTQVSVHGTDNRLMVDALRAHRQRLRGIAVIPLDCPDVEKHALKEAGVVGLRINVLYGGGIGFGDRQLPAVQSGLMATLAQGIVGGDMPWALVVVGIFFGLAMIMMQVKSPMLVAVGMSLPFETTFSIFIGGVLRAIGDWIAERRGYNAAQKARTENAGVLTASGLIAGEAVLGLVWAGMQFVPQWKAPNHPPMIFSDPSYLVGGMIVLAGLAFLMIALPLSASGDPNEPAPPTGMM